METLPKASDCVFVHYSCDLFQVGERVFAIGIRADEKTEVWPATNEQEEVTVIKNLYEYLATNSNRIIVNWKMDEYQFGPDHLTRRYKALSGLDLPIITNRWFNISSYLWYKYGEYASHPRLRNLCEMNEINLYGFHVDPEKFGTVQAKKHKVATHISAIERIHFKECRGTLRVNIPQPEQVAIRDASSTPPPKPEVYIIENARKALSDALTPYIRDDESRKNLSLILRDEEPLSPIGIYCLQASLVYVFRQLKEQNKIPAEKNKICRWLVKNFRVMEYRKSTLREINYDTAWSGLTKDLRVSMPDEKSIIYVELD